MSIPCTASAPVKEQAGFDRPATAEFAPCRHELPIAREHSTKWPFGLREAATFQHQRRLSKTSEPSYRRPTINMPHSMRFVNLTVLESFKLTQQAPKNYCKDVVLSLCTVKFRTKTATVG